MVQLLRNLFGRRSLRFGLRRDARSRFRDPRFVSFLADSNRKTLNTDFQDAVLQGRRMLRYALLLGLTAGGTWVVVESAKAFSIFK